MYTQSNIQSKSNYGSKWSYDIWLLSNKQIVFNVINVCVWYLNEKIVLILHWNYFNVRPYTIGFDSGMMSSRHIENRFLLLSILLSANVSYGVLYLLKFRHLLIMDGRGAALYALAVVQASLSWSMRSVYVTRVPIKNYWKWIKCLWTDTGHRTYKRNIMYMWTCIERER